jgi:predicted RNA-binding Zn-ribbon protein involved in translation (DUF1610 family)
MNDRTLITQQCAVCGAKLRAPASSAGKTACCPKCGDVFKIRVEYSPKQTVQEQPPPFWPANKKVVNEDPLRPVFEEDDHGAKFEIQGKLGFLYVFDDHIVISPKGIFAFLTQGLKGAKSIQFSSITAIQHRKAGPFLNGYLQFTIPGGNESKRGLFDAVADENTFLYTVTVNEIVEEAKQFIESHLRQRNAPQTSTTATLAEQIGQLAALRDQGILSDEEFRVAKTKLISG